MIINDDDNKTNANKEDDKNENDNSKKDNRSDISKGNKDSTENNDIQVRIAVIFYRRTDKRLPAAPTGLASRSALLRAVLKYQE